MAKSVSTKGKTGTTKLKCSCKNSYMDEKYGNGIRVHNGTKGDKWRCVVCLSEK